MTMKKFLAAFLSAAMVVTSAAIPVFADEAAPDASVDETVVEMADETTEEIVDEPAEETPAEEVSMEETSAEDEPAEEATEESAEDGVELMAEGVQGEMAPDDFIKAKDSNNTITLDGDVTLTKTYEIKSSQTLTIDLNGHKLTKKYEGSFGKDNSVIKFYRGGTLQYVHDITLTIKDSSPEKTGVLAGPDANVNEAYTDYNSSYGSEGAIHLFNSAGNINVIIDGATVQGGGANSVKYSQSGIYTYHTGEGSKDTTANTTIELKNGAKVLGGNAIGGSNFVELGDGIHVAQITSGGVDIKAVDSTIQGGTDKRSSQSGNAGSGICFYTQSSSTDNASSALIDNSVVLGGSCATGGDGIEASFSKHTNLTVQNNSIIKGGITESETSLGCGIKLSSSTEGGSVTVQNSELRGGDFGARNTKIFDTRYNTSYGNAIMAQTDIPVKITETKLYANSSGYGLIGYRKDQPPKDVTLSGVITVIGESENAELNTKNVAMALGSVNVIPETSMEIKGDIDSITVNNAAASNADYLKYLAENEVYEAGYYTITGLAGGGFAATTKGTGEVVGGGNVKIAYGSTTVEKTETNTDEATFNEHGLNPDVVEVIEPSDTLTNVLEDANNRPEILEDAKKKLEATDEDEISIRLQPEIQVKVVEYDETNTEISYDVTPVYHVYASKNGEAEQEIGKPIEFTIDESKEVTITLPVSNDFNGNYALIQHSHEGEIPEKFVTDTKVSGTKIQLVAHGLSPITAKKVTVNGELFELDVVAGTEIIPISPEFKYDVYDGYTVVVPNSASSVRLRGFNTNSSGTIRVNSGTSVKRGILTEEIPLNVGANKLTINTTNNRHTYELTVLRSLCTELYVYFKPVEGNNRVYDIVLKAPGEGVINRLQTADLTFALENSGETDVNYSVTASNDKVAVNPVSGSPNRYEFHFKEGNKAIDETEVVIGQVKFGGYGQIKFKVDDNYDVPNAAHATTLADNIVTDFTPNGDPGEGEGKLNLNGPDLKNEDDTVTHYGTITGDFGVETQEVTINVMFPNKLADTINNDYIKDMTVTVEGGPAFKSGKIPLGNYDEVPEALEGAVTSIKEAKFDYTTQKAPAEGTEPNANGYQIKMNVPVPADTGARYTFTFSGDGYRTFSHDVVVDGKKTITVWNNAMDDKTLIVADGDEKKDNFDVTFLAGDIVEDNKINLYDLSAVAAYFGRDKLKNEDGTPAADMDKYIQYDLNRDGQIDSKDIAMVLVSWDR